MIIILNIVFLQAERKENMTTKTQGIVLRTVKYSDKSSIATVYTREFGRTSYMIYGISGKKSAVKSALFLPLTIIEINATYHPGKEIQQLKEVKIEFSISTLFGNPVKNAIALFLTELLHKTLKRQEADEAVFDFTKKAIQMMNELEEGIANFHLIFMLKLTRYLGFEPNKENAEANYFDLMNGVFQPEKPFHNHFLNKELTRDFARLLHSDFLSMGTIHLSRTRRNDLLEGLIEYYRLHMPDFHGLHSVDVLHEIFT
ncbi:MAG: DNA repair protein RecO [Paludibacter sp.]|nr:DNA repair protein RecO [Paludibacter sp.]